jgi:hypothetical protein
MPYKSKRNRRPISTSQVSNTGVNATAVENKAAYTAPIKQASVESFVTTANFARDLKWTGIVTAIIAVLVVVALMTIPH